MSAEIDCVFRPRKTESSAGATNAYDDLEATMFAEKAFKYAIEEDEDADVFSGEELDDE